MSIEKLLQRTEKLTQRGQNRWNCRCPAHDDRIPSLSIKLLPDGVILIKCHAECEIEEIVRAFDLQMTDLFPDKLGDKMFRPRPARRALLDPTHAIQLIARDAWEILVAGENIANGCVLTQSDRQKLLLASVRLQNTIHEALS